MKQNLKIGTNVCIVTECVPKGLVPDKYAKLLYQRTDKKWYAIRMDKKDIDNILIDVVNSKEIYLLEP